MFNPLGLFRNCWAIVQKNARKSRTSLLQRGWGLFLLARKLQIDFWRAVWGLGCQGYRCWEGRAHTLCPFVSPLSEGQSGPPAAPESTALYWVIGEPWGLPEVVLPERGLPGWGDGKHLRKRSGQCEGREVWNVSAAGAESGSCQRDSVCAACFVLGPANQWAMALGRTLDEAGGQRDSHNPAWSFSLRERQRQVLEGHRAVRMR